MEKLDGFVFDTDKREELGKVAFDSVVEAKSRRIDKTQASKALALVAADVGCSAPTEAHVLKGLE